MRESLLNINLLELRAVHLALSNFRSQLAGKDVLVLTDNTTAKAHINRLGGTRSRSLMAEALQLGLWAEEHLNSIKADHISGSANIQADGLSWNLVDHGEWSIPPDLFLEIMARLGTPLVDLFASLTNHQVPRYFSRYPEPGAKSTNALHSPWPAGLLYAFLPITLVIPRVIRKLLEARTELILLAPSWPWRPWYADLMSLSVAPPWCLPDSRVALTQGSLHHPDPTWLRLTAWRLSSSS